MTWLIEKMDGKFHLNQKIINTRTHKHVDCFHLLERETNQLVPRLIQQYTYVVLFSKFSSFNAYTRRKNWLIEATRKLLIRRMNATKKTDWHYYHNTIFICFSVMCAKVYVNLYVLNHSSQCESLLHSPRSALAHTQCLFALSRFYCSKFTSIALVF